MTELKKTTCKKLVKGAKGKTSGPWQGICEGIDNKKCREAIIYLGEKGEAGLIDVEKQLGKAYSTFIERYNKEYERVKAESEVKRAEKKTVVVEPPVEKGLSKTEWAKFDKIRKEIVTKQSLQSLAEYKSLFEDLPVNKRKELIAAMTSEEKKTLAKLARELQALGDEAQAQVSAEVTARQEAKAAVDEAIEGLAQKIPRAEIEAHRHPIDPTEEPWDIDIAVFVPIGVSITLGRIKPITDAIEIFAIYFHGRALPELVTIVSSVFLEKFESKSGKKMSYYTGMAAKLLALQGYSILRPAAIESARRLDIVMGITGAAEEFSETIRRKVIEE